MAIKHVQVVEKNEGTKIEWEQTGSNGKVLAFDDYALAVNCERYRKDWDVHLDVCVDAAGNLTIGTVGATKYVAEINIPAATYHPGETEEDPPVIDPIDMSAVVLTLWAID